MNRILAQSVIAFVAIVLVVGTVSPALAAKDPVTICHFDEDTASYVIITIAKKAVKAHAKNHALDTKLAGDGTCPGDPLSAPADSKKTTICHFDEDTASYDIITIAKKAVKAHKKNHALDTKLAGDGTCPGDPL